MQRTHRIRYRLLAAAVIAIFLAPAMPAHAVSKEIVELQTQVQQLLDMVQRLQSTADQKFALLQSLTQQTADQANQMTAAVNTLQKQVQTQADAVNGKSDAVSGQVQSLNDSVDEVKSRIAKLDKSIQDLQTQLQTIQAQTAPATAPGAAPGSAPGALPGTPPTGDNNAPAGAPPGGQAGGMAPGAPAAAQAPPLADTFQSGVRDFNAARYQLASSEFQDVVHYYPLDDLAGTAQFYLGEIAYHQQNYSDSINFYTAVLTGFSGNAKAPAAQLHKGLALLMMNKREAGIKELRELIERHPQTPEAMQARTKLNGMGVRVSAKS
jgi:TolA-binding protein